MPVALVTGGGTGIGRATAIELSRAGYRVAVAGRRREPLEATLGEIGDGLVVVGDHADEDDAGRFVSDTVEQLGGLDLVVNNAGAIRRNLPVHEIDADRFDDQVRINLRGPFLVSRAALRWMITAPPSTQRSIVNVASTLAHRAFPGVASYSAAKAGVIALTRSIAIEYGKYGIRCNCVCPDIIDTPLARTDRDNWEEMAAGLHARYPVGRIGQPEDVASAIAYLAMPGASWMSGVIVDVDGGFTAGQ
jgi:NAD(P)-dependent dehydrogenase (short-subunit alcohol dehydrogenase family)